MDKRYLILIVSVGFGYTMLNYSKNWRKKEYIAPKSDVDELVSMTENDQPTIII